MYPLLIAIAAAVADDADAILGKWYTDENESIVEITKDDDGRYNGRIVWLAEPLVEAGHPQAGQPKRDIYNPVETRRDAPIIGLVILKGFEYNGRKGRWDSGTVYDPHDGRTYKCVIERGGKNGAEVLNVRGYIGIRLIGRTTKWTRVRDGEDPTNSDS